jgi:hypothetical protein
VLIRDYVKRNARSCQHVRPMMEAYRVLTLGGKRN